MFTEIKVCLYADKGDFVIKPYSFHAGPNGENHNFLKNKYFSDVAKGNYSVKFKIPEYYPDAIKNHSEFKNLWAYCYFEEFNKIPQEILQTIDN